MCMGLAGVTDPGGRDRPLGSVAIFSKSNYLFTYDCTMVITVKLYGIFQLNQPDYNVRTGLRVELPEGACAKDLLDHLGITKSQGAMIWVGYKRVPLDLVLVDNLEVKIMQVAHGG